MAAYMKPVNSGTPPMRSRRRLGIDPGADRGLEDLHRRADDVEDEDDLGLLPGLEPEGEHGGLDGDRREDQEIVAGERGTFRIEEVRADQQREHQRAEQARPALLDAEAEEFVGGSPGGAARGPGADAGFGVDETGQRRPDAGRAFGYTTPNGPLHAVPPKGRGHLAGPGLWPCGHRFIRFRLRNGRMTAKSEQMA